ncbi:hypothetical protein [Prosthecochloris vibrioformis]|uniref:Uncharacterized protein n=1 Tax=Prosthecochloris vibrioformis TaxID=1098 RepID=A0A5C4RT73_PROVB|nr:hypothetical protein [Prosthecochloris vibrioformis]TNJ34145.1 hypothetical protein FGF68_09910 [Prosthecochloris vibrioformis]
MQEQGKRFQKKLEIGSFALSALVAAGLLDRAAWLDLDRDEGQQVLPLFQIRRFLCLLCLAEWVFMCVV